MLLALIAMSRTPLSSIFANLVLITRCKAASDGENDVWAMIKANKGNNTALQSISAPSWVSASEFRGTVDIVQSCLLTLIACIYTALHLNVPTKTGFFSVLMEKIKWVLLALLAPEIVLYTAAYQLRQALKLKNQLKALQTKSASVDKGFVFDLKYAFFVTMGGVRLKTTDLACIISLPDANDSMKWTLRQLLDDDTSTLHLTASGVSHLAERDCWIYISRSKIDDKSKANSIQKALVLFQVSWMACQCTVRRCYGLPLTLLEIHTIVHVVCAIGLYAFWINKPLDVQDPEVVFDKTWLGPLAIMMVKFAYQLQLGYMERHFCGQTNNAQYHDVPISPQIISDPTYRRSYGPSVAYILTADAALKCGLGRGRLCFSSHYDQWFTLSEEASTRWELMAHELDVRYGPEPLDDRSMKNLVLQGWSSDWGEQPSLVIQTHNGSSTATGDYTTLHGMKMTVRQLPRFIALAILLPVVYGGIHLTAWDFTFPTDIEHLLWKAACLYIIVTFPLVVCIALLGVLILNHLDIPQYSSTASMGDSLYYSIGVILLIGYIFARFYIVLEALISLRKAPIGVYWTPAWLQMIPHG